VHSTGALMDSAGNNFAATRLGADQSAVTSAASSPPYLRWPAVVDLVRLWRCAAASMWSHDDETSIVMVELGFFLPSPIHARVEPCVISDYCIRHCVEAVDTAAHSFHREPIIQLDVESLLGVLVAFCCLLTWLSMRVSSRRSSWLWPYIQFD
jgi:hypothetical protein